MVGISAPSSADGIFALLDLLQKPELQDRLKQFQEAEAAAHAARQEAETARQEAEAAKADAAAKIEEWEKIQPQVEEFRSMQAKHSEWIAGINKAIGAK